MKNWTELLEIMDSKISVKVVSKDIYDFRGKFTVDGIEYAFDAAALEDGWEISFARLIKGGGSTKDVMADLELKSALKVFSGVKKLLDLWVKVMRKNDEYLNFFFTAKSDEKSRSKLYDKFAKRLAKSLKLDYDKSSEGGKEVYSFEGE